MLSDFHLHTEFSADSEAPADAMVRRAASLGMEEICITDHHDYGAAAGTLDFTLDFPAYFSRLHELRTAYQDRIRVGIGVELGLQIRVNEHLTQAAESWPFDYIIGSCHFFNGQDPYDSSYFENRSEKDAYERSFEISLERVKKLNQFDVYGHLDYIVRYGPNKNRFYGYEDYREYIDPILRMLIERGKGIECNTGGLRSGLGEPNPAWKILARYRELGGEILTVGSDAHSPEHVGYGFPSLKEALLQCGFRYYTVFRERSPHFIKIV